MDPVLSASWEIDGRARGRGDAMRSKTRRLHLRWSAKALGDAYVVFVPPNDYMRPSSDAPSVYRDDDLFLGRPIDSTGKNRALMKSWFDLCREKHKGPCQSGINPSESFSYMANSSYFGVIDVWNLQLTFLPHNDSDYEPYVALSYVWGKGERYRTLLNNVIRHKTHGAIQDAIALVPALGLRYLWVDSLCIVQDSSRSWKLNAFNMNLIYGNATLTICAADGQDSTEGLRAMHRKKRNSAQHTAEVGPGIRLMLTKPPESAIRTSTWASRAWTFQERLLSPRALIFVDGRVYFQCRSTGMSEDVVADKEGAGWSLDLVHAPLQILRQVDKKPLWVYNKAVELYTRRSLTNKEDILAAFSGTCRMLEARMSGPIVFGLPTSHFDLALLWQPEQPAIRRLISKEDAAKSSESERAFPSWAWCGWEESPMLYDAEFLDGVFRDTNAWLLKHTWITWNVRDGHGDLRQLWDKRFCGTDNTTEARWRGYRTSARVCGNQRETSSSFDDKNKSRFDLFTKPVTWHHMLKVPQDHKIALDLFGRDFEDFGDCGDYLDSPSSLLVRNARGRPFKGSLPEFPYRVVQKPYQSVMESIEHPLKPILQFHTLYKRLNLVPDTKEISNKSQAQLKRYRIADDTGDWCGSIVLDSSWVGRQQDHSQLRHEFIAISEAMRFSEEECATWTYYIPKEQEESEWDLYYVLLIRFKGDVWERIGVGKVFKEAFEGAEWDEIVLG
ncbi:heterokaryon incompatibility protein-domain-containing protein [Phaeosphaeria sp. MPI-PUGE-AT-0046c]|nr:heterokaryon incompatibility protein-domain-containing protein [Phaeosphaeria sp. MPI-PUGE-AT-0046c]